MKAKGPQRPLSSPTRSAPRGSGAPGMQASQEAWGLGRRFGDHGAACLLPPARDARGRSRGEAGLCRLLLPQRVVTRSACSGAGSALLRRWAGRCFGVIPVTNYCVGACGLPAPSKCQLGAVDEKQRRFASVTMISAMPLGLRGQTCSLGAGALEGWWVFALIFKVVRRKGEFWGFDIRAQPQVMCARLKGPACTEFFSPRGELQRTSLSAEGVTASPGGNILVLPARTCRRALLGTRVGAVLVHLTVGRWDRSGAPRGTPLSVCQPDAAIGDEGLVVCFLVFTSCFGFS